MAKRITPPPPEAAPDDTGDLLLELAEMLLSDFFFDPESEQTYKLKLAQARPTKATSVLLDEETVEVEGIECRLRIEALRALTHFRVSVSHPAFQSAVEGVWSFENEELSGVKITGTGDPDTIENVVEAIIETLDGAGLDDEEFSTFLDGLGDDEEEVPLIGDDPAEPPEATALDRNRVKAIAKRISRKRDAEVSIEDTGWLEQMPQVLPVITDALVDAARAAKRDEGLISAYQRMLGLQLEFVRYRHDRGWEWASTMLEAFQQRLIALGRDDTVPRDDWFMMCRALTEARVPIDSDTQVALADAGFKPQEQDGLPEEMLAMLRGFMDEMARMVGTPFEIIDALQSSGAMLPPMLRSFMATELALSPHQILRDAAPLLLLDEDSSVRKAAAGALEQTARADTLSSDSLRRAITVRNWIPTADRVPLDAAIRKARLAGVDIGGWPEPVRDLEFYASMIDGSGAQTIIAVSRIGKKGLFAGLLLRHGDGVIDSWADQDLSRAKINKLLREAQMATPCARVDRTFVDTMIQHAIGTSVAHNAVPPSTLLEMAELLGGSEWKGRRLDINAEADRLFAALDPADQTPAGIQAGFSRGLDWLAGDDVFGSWFEDGPQVQKVLAKLPRTDRAGMAALVMTDILPPRRAEWTERFLMLAMWCQATSDAKHQAKARDLTLVAHALASDAPLESIPIMAVIAMQTVRATLLGAW